ncbi:hypothetical protein BJY04DRAFT_191351 [Aspergillus karnatakaensis]|uniref:uncharacterized protein n=1 Tax=Aspergillus karnatakaensis TaxID=1810916 RepID=UPI003CCCACAA
MRSWVALALVALLSGTTSAEECHRDFTITATTNTTAAFAPCTTIIGNIDVAPGFNGNIDLDNVYNITGSIELRADTIHDDTRPIVHYLLANDLIHLGGLYINDFSVYELYMRSLETVGDISIYVDQYALNLDLDSLVEADGISISRAVSTVNLRSLETVHNALVIDYHPANSSTEDHEPTGLNNGGRIELESLESAGAVALAGARNGVYLPRLTTVGSAPGPASDWGLTINLDKMEEAYELDLPRLRSVDKEILLLGNVKEINTPSLQNFTSLNVTSSANFDCDTFLADIENSSAFLHNESTVSCTGTKPGGLSQGAKIAIGVVVPVVVIAIIAAIAVLFTRKKSRRESRARMELRGVTTEIPMQRESERVTGVGAGSDDRPLTPPPPYSPNPNGR